MMATVETVEVARVPVPDAVALPPLLKLSALEAQWLAIPLIQRLLVFVDDGGHVRPFETVVASLRASLAATLARFSPLAGRIIFLPSTGDAAIDCSSGGGARFVVAEGGDVEAARIATEADHDVDTFKRLVPELHAAALPADTMAVEVDG